MQEYTLAPLGHPPVTMYEDGYTAVYGINKNQQVAGYASGEAARWDNGRLVALPTPRDMSYAMGINDAGVLVGFHHLVYPTRAFYFTNGQLVDFSADLPGEESVAIAVNNAGLVVGRSGTIGDQSAFAYDIATRRMTAQMRLPGHGFAIAHVVNDAGHVAGTSRRQDDTDSRIFFYRDGETRDFGAAVDLYGLNNSDIGCGSRFFEANHESRAFRVDMSGDAPVFEDLGHSRQPGSFYSRANAINNAGIVVGTSGVPRVGSYQAFVHYPADHPDAGYHDLNSLIHNADDWDVENAVGITDDGVIIGNGQHEGVGRSFILYPVRQRSAVDEFALSFVTIFGGVTSGGAGTGIVPGGPPVPIPNPLWHELLPAQRDLYLSAAIRGLASGLGEHRAAAMLRDVADRVTATANDELRQVGGSQVGGSQVQEPPPV